MNELIIEEIGKNIPFNLETIIARERPKRKKFPTNNLKIGDSLFAEYFVSNIKDKQLNAFEDKGIDIFNLVAVDYYQRFDGAWKKYIRPEIIIESFVDLLNTKEPIDYKRNDTEEVFALPDVESEIVSSVYLNFIRDERIKGLIKRASNMDDLKAILMIDNILPSLICNKVSEILESNLNPEQIFITLAKIKYGERNIRDIDNYMNEIEKISEESKGIIKNELTKKNAEKLVGFIEKIGRYPIEHLRDEEGYTNTVVGRFFGIQEDLLDLITRYINNSTIHTLNLINPEFNLSDDIELDIEKSKQNLNLFERVKRNYEWFRRDKSDLIEPESKVKARHNYLTKVVDIKINLETRLKELNNYLIEIENIESETLDHSLVKRVLEIEENSKNYLQDFREWVSNNYLAENVKQLFNISNNCLEIVDNKKKQIISEARNKVFRLNLGFESSGTIEQDLAISKNQQIMYKKVIVIYELLERSHDELHEKGNAILKSVEKYEGIAEKWKEIKKDKERIIGYETSAKELLDKIINENTVETINSMFVDIVDNLVKYEEYSKTNYLMFYKDIANYINNTFGIIAITRNKITNFLGGKDLEIKGLIKDISSEIDEYYQKNKGLKRVISIFNVPQHIHIKRMNKKLQVYNYELENLGDIHYGNFLI